MFAVRRSLAALPRRQPFQLGLRSGFSSMPTTSVNGKYYLLIYEFQDDFIKLRAPHRREHLDLAEEYKKDGYLLLGGVLEGGEPANGAFVFKAPDESLVAEFAEADPYVTHGVVTDFEIRPWNVVIDAFQDKE